MENGKRIAIKFAQWLLDNGVEPKWDINDGDLKLWQYKGFLYSTSEIYEEFENHKIR